MLNKDAEFYTLKDISTNFSVPVSTLRQWCNDGTLKAVKLPSGQWRARRADVYKLLSTTTPNRR